MFSVYMIHRDVLKSRRSALNKLLYLCIHTSYKPNHFSDTMTYLKVFQQESNKIFLVTFTAVLIILPLLFLQLLFMGWWCSGILSGLPRRRSGVQIPDPPTLEKCAKGICLCNLLRSTQPNDRETVIEG